METTEKTSEEDLERYYAAYSDPFVLHLRKSLDNYMTGSSEGMESFEFVTESHLPGRPSGLNAFKEYLSSKFVVMWLADALMGGKIITVLFRDKPDKLFDAWVYRLAGGEYDLRAWWSKDIDPEGLKKFIGHSQQLIMEDKHAL